MFYNKLVGAKDILEVIAERGQDYFPALTDTDIKTMEDFVALGRNEAHAGFGESAMIMGTYPELVRLDRCQVDSGESTHIADPLTQAGITWGRTWQVNYPNSYSALPPLGLTQAIADAAVEISVERTVEALKLLKNDAIMDPIIQAGRR